MTTTTEQWYRFEAYNSQSEYGYGTEAGAYAYAAKLNTNRTVGHYTPVPLGNSDEVDAKYAPQNGGEGFDLTEALE